MSNEISIIHKSLKVRLYPTENQEILINKAFGCCRFVYNRHKEERDTFYNENIKDKNLSKKDADYLITPPTYHFNIPVIENKDKKDT